MKKYVKAEIIAKNATTGSYAAGCPTHHSTGTSNTCKKCETTW